MLPSYACNGLYYCESWTILKSYSDDTAPITYRSIYESPFRSYNSRATIVAHYNENFFCGYRIKNLIYIKILEVNIILSVKTLNFKNKFNRSITIRLWLYI